MKKYIIWTSLTTGEYIKADKVIEEFDTVSFIREGLVSVVVKSYKKHKIIDYHEVEN